MKSIEPEIANNDSYSNWLNEAGPYMNLLKKSREQAIALLADPHPDARIAAIGSFRFLWPFDATVARKFLDLATKDCDTVVRYTAAASLLLMHLGCKDPNDKTILEEMLCDIARTSCQVPEIIADVDGYLKIMTADLAC